MSKYLTETETDLWAHRSGDSDDDWETDADYVNDATESEQRQGGTKDRFEKQFEEKKHTSIVGVRKHAKQQDEQAANAAFKNRVGYYGGSTTKTGIGQNTVHNYDKVRDESKGPKAGTRTNVQAGWKGRMKGKAIKRKAGKGKWAKRGGGKGKGKGKKGPKKGFKKGAKKGAKKGGAPVGGGNRAPPKPSGPSAFELARKREEEARQKEKAEQQAAAQRKAEQEAKQKAEEQAKREQEEAERLAYEEEEAAIAAAYEEEEAAAAAAYEAEEEAAAAAAYEAEEEAAAAAAYEAEEEAAAAAAYEEEEAAYAYEEEEAAYEGEAYEEEAYEEEAYEEAYEEEAYEEGGYEEAYEEEGYGEEAYEEEEGYGYEEGYEEEGYEEEGYAETCTAIGDWTGEAEGDISFVTGDIITVTDRTTDPEGWWSGYNAAGVQGDFPSTYVELNY